MKTKFLIPIIIVLLTSTACCFYLWNKNIELQNLDSTSTNSGDLNTIDPRYLTDEKFCLIDSDCMADTTCDKCNCPDTINKYTPQTKLKCPQNINQLCEKPLCEFKCENNRCTVMIGDNLPEENLPGKNNTTNSEDCEREGGNWMILNIGDATFWGCNFHEVNKKYITIKGKFEETKDGGWIEGYLIDNYEIKKYNADYIASEYANKTVEITGTPFEENYECTPDIQCRKGAWVMRDIQSITITENNLTEKQKDCIIDDDCKEIDCSEFQEPLEYYPICEYNKCICGCGDLENGKLCR